MGEDGASEDGRSGARTQTIHFIRHGQGEHNIESSGYLLADAVLTAVGRAQVQELRDSAALANNPPQFVAVSPLRRTMQTALLAFPDTPCVLLPCIMESGMVPCDCATPHLGRELLRTHEGAERLLAQYEGLPSGWEVKGKEWKGSVLERFAELIELLESRPEECVAVVGHLRWFKMAPNLCRGTAQFPSPAFLVAWRAPAQSEAQPWQLTPRETP